MGLDCFALLAITGKQAGNGWEVSWNQRAWITTVNYRDYYERI